ncbi:MAG TPA: methionyl-tRNA formyltransferase [Cytophagales bacterium]|nr:methionyl-tRNA formyltransferase [Cytophagales bacterium]HAA21318.1 methionyl-tRNA formyltransferase [Cytophagales bacterium]HAP63779.1 methionyl-tRNA formyltransferase [Cytophagales bacterium]
MSNETSPQDLRIVYMGTPEFAVPSLNILVENGFNVVGVITAPDKPKGRGQKVATSAVKEAALKHGLHIMQPTKLKDPDFQAELRSLKANLQVVVAFRMLPEAVWDMPEIGTFNLHGSLLPQYRGAAPINWAIMNGETETGVTTFFLKHEIDTGHIIFQDKEPIHEADTVGDVYGRLMERGAKLVLKTVQAIAEGKYPQVPQDETGDLKPAPKIFKETCEINWDQATDRVYDFIRGLSPYPAAWTTVNGSQLKIYRTEKVEGRKLGVGEFVTDNKKELLFGTTDGALAVLELQLQGKRRMAIEDFLRGNKL